MQYIRSSICLLFTLVLLLACKTENKGKTQVNIGFKEVPLKYAEGFEIFEHKRGKLLCIKDDSGEGKWFGFATTEEGLQEVSSAYREIKGRSLDAALLVPATRLVSNSTTHVAALEMLGTSNLLVGFTGTELVSSPHTRKLIDSGKIKELGIAGKFDPEGLLAIRPDLILTFGIDGEQKEIRTASNHEIPVIFIGEWKEKTPLGRAEWLKVFGLISGRYAESWQLFANMDRRYNELKFSVANAAPAPRVLSGSLYKDVFYAPSGTNWMALLITDAGGDYLWKHTQLDGSLQLSIEEVYQSARDADHWLGCGQFGTTKDLRESHPLIAELKSVDSGNVYTYMHNKGSTGGLLFFEQATFRPDLLLEDAIRVFGSDTLNINESRLNFFSPLAP